MGYTALTAFLDVKKRRSPEEAARLKTFQQES